jgi:rod shape-determining protein MreC
VEHRSSAILRVAAPLKSLLQRFTYIGLIIAAFGLILIGKVDAVLVDRFQGNVVDVVAPVLELISSPIATVSNGIQTFNNLKIIRTENVYLKQKIMRLMQWQAVAQKLQAENIALHKLLGVVRDKKVKYITARVIAGSGGTLSNMLILNSGKKDGVRKGQAVVSDRGIVGRVQQVSSRSARVLMLTDINSRVPVLMVNTRIRAVMTGSNNAQAKLIHLPQEARVALGDRVVTSGHGGAFPPGLPVGTIASVGTKGIDVQLFTNFSRLEYVSIADFGLNIVESMRARDIASKTKVFGKSVAK